MAKRTYSKYGKGQRSTPYDPNWVTDNDSPKRAKVDGSAAVRLPKGRTEMKSSLLKKGLKFGGPVSLPEDAMDIDEQPVIKKKTSVFDRVLSSGRYQAAKPSQIKLQSSAEDSPKTPPTQQQHHYQPRNYQLPTPPAEAQKARQAHHQARDLQVLSSGTHYPNAAVPKLHYIPNVHEAKETPAPRRTILGDRLSKNSMESALWRTNQTNSPLLQLPAEVRTKIFEYALGGNTIHIDYETYRTTSKMHKPKTSVPIFKYRCTVYDRRTNPFKMQSPQETVTTHYCTLNNICRQFYIETAHLPYKLNMISFGSASIMFNFLYQEQRLSRKQRDAITELVLPDVLLQQNMLNDLRGLRKFYLGRTMNANVKGWYTVVRREGCAAKLVPSSSLRY
ncbi:hypothetical protein T440DRAFT_462971 [Plenodomus tracheiphilus IPT5]|uniref:DUF7730 domain-containing protein n=1 Tax=Plenodomus tracheiphilus IPT5 TaxID=1408161 RepID=A0A6A7BPY5_9PLEO|nr:hypothetical protein T440DRAFT_462971 [Plenodomus tracheiphilus IPT5]